MVQRSHATAASAAALAFVFLPLQSVRSEESTTLDPVVVTATRSPLAVSRAGSAITVLRGEEIEAHGQRSMRDVLADVPGLEIHESGGTGSAANVTLRGSKPGQTLVMVDGMRFGDPAAVDGSVDLGAIAVTDIERIEVLRGPQSALYGSDAMGGVVNIITRRGNGAPKSSLTLEGGSYGTLHGRATTSGSNERWTWALAVDALHSDSFPRYGYRARRPIFIGDGVTPLPPLPGGDPVDKGGATARVTYRLSDDVTLEAGLAGFGDRIKIDNPFAMSATNVFAPFNRSTAQSGEAFGKLTADTFGGVWRHQITVFGSSTDRRIAETETCPDFTSNCTTNYRGARSGGEYQGDLKLGAFGLLIFGARTQTETATTSQDYDAASGGAHVPGVSARQTTSSLFALHQFTLADRVDLSFGGRLDSVAGGRDFATWRTTAAWRVGEAGTKLRASLGTGARTPSLYQRFSIYGVSTLQPEQSIGWDAGIDQPLWNGRASVSATIFSNNYRNLIDYTFNPAACPPANTQGCYFNVGRARTSGVELAADAQLWPDVLRLRASYTALDARDLTGNTALLQQPRSKVGASLLYTGVPKLDLEGRMTFVGSRIDYGPARLKPYARFDAFANYRVTDTVAVFARVENLTDIRYEEVFNYGVSGRAVYGGVKVTW